MKNKKINKKNKTKIKHPNILIRNYFYVNKMNKNK